MRALFFARKRKTLFFIFTFILLLSSQITFRQWLLLKQEFTIASFKLTGYKVSVYKDIVVISKKPLTQSFLATINNLYAQEKKYFSYNGKSRVVIVFTQKQNLGGLFFPLSEGYYWGGVVYLPEDLETKALPHEMSHLIVDVKTGGKISRYLHEGFAQWLEVNIGLPPAFIGDEKKIFFTIKDLEKNLDNEENQYAAYRQSYYFIKFLEGEKGRKGIEQFLEETQKSNLEKAFIKVYGGGEEKLFAKFLKWYQFYLNYHS